MADLQFDDFEGGYAALSRDGRLERARRLVNSAGAVCSVALVLGLGYWGYQLAVRDVAGVPVMRALVGPMRVAPSDPGGNQASNQGLSVNAVAATGTSAPLADQITLAPRPVELLPGDTAFAVTAVAASAGEPLPIPLAISGQASPGATASLLITEAAPLDQGAAPVIANADPETAAPSGRSLRPHARPLAFVSAESTVSNVETVAASASATEIDPTTLVAGTRLAQLGAFDTPELAHERFAELQTKFGDLMSGKAMVVQAAQSGGRSFYRLRAHGFEGDDEARRFCAALQAEDTDCIPVAQR